MTSNYSFQVENWSGSLPLWAQKNISEFYRNSEIPKEFLNTMTLDEIKKKTEIEILEEAKNFFLPAPENWLTKEMYPELFLIN